MKQLITAETLRAAHAEGKTRIEITLPDCIVTPEARVVAERLGVEIIEILATKKPVVTEIAPVVTAAPAAPAADHEASMAAIRQAVLAQLPAGSVPESVIDQLVRKVAAEQMNPPAGGAPVAGYESLTLKSGIKRVTGSSVKMGLLDGAGANQIGIADVITGADGSSMAAGFMRWENCFFPWTLGYDEVDIVLEGELHIRCNGETAIARAGDVIFIPKNSSIEFGTPTTVHFLYVAYPANWQNC